MVAVRLALLPAQTTQKSAIQTWVEAQLKNDKGDSWSKARKIMAIIHRRTLSRKAVLLVLPPPHGYDDCFFLKSVYRLYATFRL